MRDERESGERVERGWREGGADLGRGVLDEGRGGGGR